MKPQDIKLNDFERVFFGQVPPLFFVELIIRAAVVYLLLMVCMRTMGKRMSSQLSRNEMAAVVSLAAAIGIPLMNAERGILPAVVVGIVIVSLQILIAKLAAKSEAFESISQDKLASLVNNGKMDLKQMQKTRISKDRLFAQLRSAQVVHLGEVKRLYFEANGNFSILKETENLPGLPVIPKFDADFLTSKTNPTDYAACSTCGQIKAKQEVTPHSLCPNCGHLDWADAVTGIKH